MKKVQDEYISEPDVKSEDDDSSDDLEPMTVSQLKHKTWKQLNELCVQMKLTSSGKKVVLKAQLMDSNNNNHRERRRIDSVCGWSCNPFRSKMRKRFPVHGQTED